jgi:uncharacterized protein YndB with AHSA1/START domain
MTNAPIPPITGTVTVALPVDEAFALFTSAIDRWWPRAFHIGAAEVDEIVLEPFVDGRWYERGVDGSECTWGEVLAYDAPRRLVLSWHLNGEWAYDPDPAHASEIEVTFTPDGDGTRVELVHRGFERHGATAEALRDGVSREGGWGGLLKLYSEALGSS